jgi:rubrerythrin
MLGRMAATEVLYARVAADLKGAVDRYADDHGLSITAGVGRLLELGLRTDADGTPSEQLRRRAERAEQRLTRAQTELTTVRTELDGAQQRERALAGAHEALARRISGVVGSCPACGKPVKGSDVLVDGTCPACSVSLASLATPDQPGKVGKGGLDPTEYKLLIGAVGVLLGIAIASGVRGG